MRYDVTIHRLPARAILDVKGDVAPVVDALVMSEDDNHGDTARSVELPVTPNTRLLHKDLSVCWLGREHWWLLAPSDSELGFHQQVKAVRASDGTSAVVLSESMVFLSLSGPEVEDVIAIASPMDIHESRFPSDSVSWTDLFGLKVLLLRVDSATFELAIDYSFMPMVADCLGRSVGADLSQLVNPVQSSSKTV